MKIFAMILVLAGLPVIARVAVKPPEVPPKLPVGVNVVDWKQIKAEYQRHRHAFFPVPGAILRERGNSSGWRRSTAAVSR